MASGAGVGGRGWRLKNTWAVLMNFVNTVNISFVLSLGAAYPSLVCAGAFVCLVVSVVGSLSIQVGGGIGDVSLR